MSSPRGTKACGGVAADRQIHVLAVDDSSVDRAVIARILRSSKYRGINNLIQVFGGRSGGFLAQARPPIGCVSAVQSDAIAAENDGKG
ncbi:hypothetical protein BHE74_00035973 [Ensete ventricosum]|nr:hypothetical protein BHE74_00035973 [Ensete ventricosum]